MCISPFTPSHLSPTVRIHTTTGFLASLFKEKRFSIWGKFCCSWCVGAPCSRAAVTAASVTRSVRFTRFLPKSEKVTPRNANFFSVSSRSIGKMSPPTEMLENSFLQRERSRWWMTISKEKNHVKRNRVSSRCIVCLYYSFYKIVNLCNSI